MSPAPSGRVRRGRSLLVEGKFFAPWTENVNTVGSLCRIAAVPVPLVDIRVDDHHALHETCGLDGAGGDGGVVEDAVSLAPACERVVRPPARLAAKPSSRAARQAPRAARGAAGAFNHLLRPRKADAPDLLVGERAGDDAFEVVGAWARRISSSVTARGVESSPAADPIARDPLAQHRVLDHREPVASGRGSTKWSL